MNALGRHLLLELNDCDRKALNDLGFLKDTLLTAARESGATVLGESFHFFSPQGVSGVVIISESHMSIHTWPEYGYAAADIFTCGDTVQPEKAAEILVEKLGSRNPSVTEIQRGLLVTV
ncbi:MAG: adenosylmethionine decarboxylase [Chloroflexota bacterium]